MTPTYISTSLAAAGAIVAFAATVASAPVRAGGVKLYEGPHLPPGLRHHPGFGRRQIPYGGVATFGAQPVGIPYAGRLAHLFF
ncbi:hypothetical protein GQ54DRAFT_310961 [Martensiomyces pterosporus]|nr:hypothetical protein GQ54DRAFT_310961 [Martensiomyces pterosporus]